MVFPLNLQLEGIFHGYCMLNNQRVLFLVKPVKANFQTDPTLKSDDGEISWK